MSLKHCGHSNIVCQEGIMQALYLISELSPFIVRGAILEGLG